MNLNFGKSLLKGAKYVGLTLAAGAVTGVGVEVANLGPILIQAGVPAAVAVLAANIAAPALGGVLAIAVQQLLSHRNDSNSS